MRTLLGSLMLFTLAPCCSLLVIVAAHAAEATLSAAEVTLIANKAAVAAGHKLSFFQQPRLRYERTQERSTWVVSYEGKELKLGNHFLVFVEDPSKHARVVGGE
jgi:hypothetical protein